MKHHVLWKLWSSPALQAAAGPASLALLLLLFLGDLLVPLGYAFALLNTLAILLAFFSRQPRWIMLITALGISSTLLVPVLTPAAPGIPHSMMLFNRSLSVAVCLLSGYSAIEILALIAKVRDTNSDLRQSNDLLEIASRVGKLGGWHADLVKQTISWSDEVARIHGHAPGYSPGFEEAFSYYPEEYRQRLLVHFNLCVEQGRSFDLDLQIRTVQGQQRWIRAVGRPVRNAQHQVIGVHGAFQDIQSEMNSRLEILRSAERWHALAEAMPLTVWTADAQGQVDFFSRQLMHYLQVTLPELTGSGWLQYLHQEDGETIRHTWAQHVDTREPFEAELRLRRHDGEYEWHLLRAVFMRGANQQGKWYGSIMNIHALKCLQQETTRLAERLSATMESVADAIITVDRQWRITYMNSHAELLLQRRREELLNQVIWDAFPDAVGTVFEEQYQRCLHERVTVRFEAWFQPLEMLFEVNAFPSDEGFSVYFRNITQQRALAQQMQQMQKLDALGQLTGGVAHDFNNLLTVIMGNCELLQDQLDEHPDLKSLAALAIGAAERAAELTRHMLAFARKQTLEPQSCDLNQLVTGLAPLLQRSIGADVALQVVEADTLWPAFVDQGQLENCLLNLAINARDAMPQGGKLVVEVRNAHLDGDYTAQHPDLAPGDYVQLAVTDNGQGIPADILPKVFDPFFTTKENGKGTGLGLAMVYGFVKQSHGHITIYSEPGQGTTIRIYLPRHRPPEGAAAQAGTAQTREAGHGELVLLVEDDPLVQQYTHGQLLDLGYRVLVASNGREALDLLQAVPDIDLLFTDVVMPGGMNGDQLARKARELRPALPVLFTSGYAENAIVHQGRLDPGVLLLAKPYRRAELAARLRQALAGL